MEKDVAHRIIDRMPPNATWDDLMREIYVREVVERGLADSKAGRTDTAEGHLDAVYAHIAQDSPEYARHMVDRLTRRSQQIADFPFSGRRVPEYDIEQIREVIEGSFRIIYHIKSDQIDVLAVIHGARDVLGRSEQEDK
jgi:plasmid stabilization system protein ParE